MKIGVSSYSFSRLVRAGKMTQFESITTAADMGFAYIEFSGLEVPSGEDILAYAARVREYCASKGIAMGNYTIGADFLNGMDGDFDAEVSRLIREVDVAHALGASGMRHDVTRGRQTGSTRPAFSAAPAESFADVLPLLARGCRAVTEYAASLGIRTMSENHGYFCQDSERVEKLVSAVNHPNYGVLIDIGNFLCVDESPVTAVSRLAPYAFHLHVKDFHFKTGQEPSPGEGWFATRGQNRLRGAIIGHGVVPVRQCLDIMKKAGYEGSVSIEFEGMEDPLLGIRIGLQNLQAYLG
jgi:sugar phosphate isomerase/epimerase